MMWFIFIIFLLFAIEKQCLKLSLIFWFSIQCICIISTFLIFSTEKVQIWLGLRNIRAAQLYPFYCFLNTTFETIMVLWCSWKRVRVFTYLELLTICTFILRRIPSWVTVTFCTSWSIRARLGLEKQESKRSLKYENKMFFCIYIQKLLQTKNIRGPTDEQQISESASFLLISITNKTFSLLNRLLVPVIGSIDWKCLLLCTVLCSVESSGSSF